MASLLLLSIAMELPKRLLVATDFSPTSDRALDYAIEFAKLTEGAITLVHAYELPIVGFPDGALLASAELSTRLVTAAQAALANQAESRMGRGVTIKWLLRQGLPHEEVGKVADDMNADLIVIGTHARKGLARALLGSVAEKIIRTVERPILTVHGPRDDR